MARPLTQEKLFQVAYYYDTIKNPVYLNLIRGELDAQAFSTLDAFASDIMLMLDNCRTFNQEGTEYFKAADRLQVRLFHFLLFRLSCFISVEGSCYFFI